MHAASNGSNVVGVGAVALTWLALRYRSLLPAILLHGFGVPVRSGRQSAGAPKKELPRRRPWRRLHNPEHAGARRPLDGRYGFDWIRDGISAPWVSQEGGAPMIWASGNEHLSLATGRTPDTLMGNGAAALIVGTIMIGGPRLLRLFEGNPPGVYSIGILTSWWNEARQRQAAALEISPQFALPPHGDCRHHLLKKRQT